MENQAGETLVIDGGGCRKGTRIQTETVVDEMDMKTEKVSVLESGIRIMNVAEMLTGIATIML